MPYPFIIINYSTFLSLKNKDKEGWIIQFTQSLL